MIEYNGPEWWAPPLAIMVGVVWLALLHLASRISKAWGARHELPLHVRLHVLPAWRNFLIWRDINRNGP